MLALTFATTVHIGVLGSFHPVQLEVRPAHNSVLVVDVPGRSEVIQTPAFVTLDGPAKITGPKGSFTRFTICLPNGVEREYYGRLEVRRHFYELQLIVEMDREVAVASILAAEGAYSLPPEALRAQAIAARSYMLAVSGRHDGFDMCDTTHCQRLESPPSPNNVVSKAAQATRGEVLTYQNKIVPAMYSANCGGHTKSFGSAILSPGDYPFIAVACSRRGTRIGSRRRTVPARCDGYGECGRERRGNSRALFSRHRDRRHRQYDTTFDADRETHPVQQRECLREAHAFAANTRWTDGDAEEWLRKSSREPDALKIRLPSRHSEHSEESAFRVGQVPGLRRPLRPPVDTQRMLVTPNPVPQAKCESRTTADTDARAASSTPDKSAPRASPAPAHAATSAATTPAIDRRAVSTRPEVHPSLR